MYLKAIFSAVCIQLLFGLFGYSQSYKLDNSFGFGHYFLHQEGGQETNVCNVYQRNPDSLYILGTFYNPHYCLSLPESENPSGVLLCDNFGHITCGYPVIGDCSYGFCFDNFIYEYSTVSTIWRSNIDGLDDTLNWNYNLMSIGPCSFSKFYIRPDSTFIAGANWCNPFGSAKDERFQLVRILKDGNIDSSYVSYADGVITYVVQYDSDRLMVSGLFNSFNSFPTRRLCRVFNDGQIDTTFKSRLTFGGCKLEYAEKNGKSIVIGFFGLEGYLDTFTVARLLVDGSLDTTFNNFNAVPAYYNNKSAGVLNVLPTYDSLGYLMSGSFARYQGYDRNSIVKTDINGYIDTTAFKNGGIIVDFQFWSGNFDDIQPRVHLKRDKDFKYFAYGDFNSYEGQEVGPAIRIMEDYNSSPIVEISEEDEFVLFPNPTNKNLIIEYKNSGFFTLRIVDVFGNENYFKAENQREVELDISFLSKGIHICILKTKNGKIHYEKLLVI